jgi:hypothetical protein
MNHEVEHDKIMMQGTRSEAITLSVKRQKHTSIGCTRDSPRDCAMKTVIRMKGKKSISLFSTPT